MFTVFPISRGVHMMRQQRYADALRYFDDLSRRGVRAAAARFNAGVCCFKTGDLAGARARLHAALENDQSPAMVSDILEITNWEMIASHRWFNAWPQFSADGTMLAYTSTRRCTNGDGRINNLDCAGLYLYDPARRQETCLDDDPGRHYAQPRFSPDGKKLAFLSSRDAAADMSRTGLYLKDLATGEERELLNASSRIKYHRFSPDGRTIIVSGWLSGAAVSGIAAIDLATGAVAPIINGVHETTAPDISPGGDSLVCSSWRCDSNNDGIIDFRDYSGIYLRSLVDGNETVLTQEGYNNLFPQFSPDGRYVLYLSIRRDTNRDGKIDLMDNAGLYLYDLHRHTERCLVDDHYYNKFPVFTPDGQRVVFISNWRRKKYADEVDDKFENKGVYMTDLAGSAIVRIMSDKYYGSRSPVVAAGDRTAYISWRKDTGRGLYLARLDRLPAAKDVHAYIDANL